MARIPGGYPTAGYRAAKGGGSADSGFQRLLGQRSSLSKESPADYHRSTSTDRGADLRRLINREYVAISQPYTAVAPPSRTLTFGELAKQMPKAAARLAAQRAAPSPVIGLGVRFALRLAEGLLAVPSPDRVHLGSFTVDSQDCGLPKEFYFNPGPVFACGYRTAYAKVHFNEWTAANTVSTGYEREDAGDTVNDWYRHSGFFTEPVGFLDPSVPPSIQRVRLLSPQAIADLAQDFKVGFRDLPNRENSPWEAQAQSRGYRMPLPLGQVDKPVERKPPDWEMGKGFVPKAIPVTNLRRRVLRLPQPPRRGRRQKVKERKFHVGLNKAMIQYSWDGAPVHYGLLTEFREFVDIVYEQVQAAIRRNEIIAGALLRAAGDSHATKNDRIIAAALAKIRRKEGIIRERYASSRDFGNVSMSGKLKSIWDNFDLLGAGDWGQISKDVLWNEIEDFWYGQIGQAAKKASALGLGKMSHGIQLGSAFDPRIPVGLTTLTGRDPIGRLLAAIRPDVQVYTPRRAVRPSYPGPLIPRR